MLNSEMFYGIQHLGAATNEGVEGGLNSSASTLDEG